MTFEERLEKFLTYKTTYSQPQHLPCGFNGVYGRIECTNFFHKIYIGIQLLDKLEVMQTNRKIVNNVKIITMDKYAL